jgi:GntR family transcriptional regulator
VRQVAADLDINLNTVARAYRELTESGLLAWVHGEGTLVIATVERTSGPRAEESKRTESGIAASLAQAKIAGLSRETVSIMLAR